MQPLQQMTDQVRYGVEDFFVSQKMSDLCLLCKIIDPHFLMMKKVYGVYVT